MPISVITLGAGHSIISGHKPSIVEESNLLKAIEDSNKTHEVASFGLFGGGLNYNTYYPEVKPEDLLPKDEEFIEPVYRLLSECIISKYYPTDFSVNGVLKKSMPLLIGQTVNCDHDSEVGNAIGAVKSVFWQEAYTDPSGVKIPAGINGVFKIDAKANPRLARGILMDPPSIHSNSVTIKFAWEKSHPELSDSEFYDKMGSYDKDGVLIRRIVTDIIAYAETSLVSNGADPFAKLIKDGRIVLPEKAGRIYNSYSEDPVMAHQALFSDFKTISKIAVMSNSEQPLISGDNEPDITQDITENNDNPNKNENSMNELQEFLATLFGDGLLTLNEGQEVNAELALTCIKGLVTEVNTLTSKVNTLTEENQELSALRTESEQNKIVVEFGTAQLTELRNKTLENYRKLYSQEDELIVNLINTGDYKTVQSLSKSYEASLEDKYPVTCKECGSSNVSRSSSVSASAGTDKEGQVLSTQDALSEIRRKKNKGDNQ